MNETLTAFVNPLFILSTPNDAMPAEMDSVSLFGSLLTEIGNIALQAQALIDNGQSIDLSGLEARMGLLCAKALDLPPPLRPQARAELATLQSPIERLFETLAKRTAA
jgi:hypothetical protein